MIMAERTGLEPATPGVTGRYSNQLNYRSKLGIGSQFLADRTVMRTSLTSELVGAEGIEPPTFAL